MQLPIDPSRCSYKTRRLPLTGKATFAFRSLIYLSKGDDRNTFSVVSPGMPEESVSRISKMKDSTQFAEERRRRQSRSPGVAASETGKFCQEIHDEFLVCKICLDSYKSPKCLSCLHTFCEQCIDNHIASETTYKKYCDYREFTCPLCRKRTQLPVGGVKKLPDNFLVSSLSEMVMRQKPSKVPYCDICKMISKRQKEATSKCLECSKLLCKSCVDVHRETKVTRGHSTFDVDIEDDVMCKEHTDEVVRFYCEPCQTCICVLCTFNEHRDHEITNFSEAVSKYKTDIEQLLDHCKQSIQLYETNITQLTKTERIIKDAEQKIHDLAIDFISEVRQREKHLVDEIHRLYGKQTIDLLTRKAEMQTQLDNLRSTCSLTEVVLNGKDIELLLLKKDVQEKLSLLNQGMTSELPGAIIKEIKFIPGKMELGMIVDIGARDDKKFRISSIQNEKVFKLSNDTNLMAEIEERHCQTDTVQIRENVSSSDQNVQTSPISYCDQELNTEPITTQEKAVNTRSRSMRQAHHGSNDGDSSEPTRADPSGRRHRRRVREAQQPKSEDTENQASSEQSTDFTLTIEATTKSFEETDI